MMRRAIEERATQTVRIRIEDVCADSAMIVGAL